MQVIKKNLEHFDMILTFLIVWPPIHLRRPLRSLTQWFDKKDQVITSLLAAT